MAQLAPNRRFQIAYDRTRAEWAAADLAQCAALAGCTLTREEVVVPYFGRPHLVTHPAGLVWATTGGASTGGATAGGATAEGSPLRAGTGGATAEGSPLRAGWKPAHVTIAILLMHYLLKADGTPPADRWLAFRQLPDGMFYAQAFADHAENPLAQRFGSDVADFCRAATALGGTRLDAAPGGGLAPPDAFFRFQALPRLAIAAQLWEGDEDFPGQVRILFDAHAGHYLPTEDLSGIGDWLAHKLTHA